MAAGVISVDGPTAAGKSTLGQSLARHYDCRFLDTGLTYRAATYLLVHGVAQGVDACADVLRQINHTPFTRAEQEAVWFAGEDITEAIFGVDVDNNIALVAGHKATRRAILEYHESILEGSSTIVAGRDVAMTLGAEACAHIFLDCEFVTRRNRRRRQVLAEPFRSVSVGASTPLDVEARRVISSSPRGKVIDTTALSVGEVHDLALRHAEVQCHDF